MSLFIYNLSLLLFRIGIVVASVFNRKAALFLKGRRNQFLDMERELVDGTPIIWFHCASLGEFEQGRPVIAATRQRFSDHKILITFFSPSGYEVRKNFDGADYIYYLPVDTSKNVKRFIGLVKPAMAIFVKYEFWYHYFSILDNQNIPIISISAVFRPEQIYFKKYGKFNANILQFTNHIFTQDVASRDLLKGIGIDQVTVAGDTRFDRVSKIRNEDIENTLIEEFCGESKVLIIGSSWPEDHALLLPFINSSEEGLRFIIAPHEIIESRLSQLEKSVNLPGIRYSQANMENIADCRYLIIDSVGMLAQIYKYGHFAYIGGAFGAGLHNILEAAAFGLPLFFGDRNYLKFREANELIEIGGAIPVANTEEFQTSFADLRDDEIRLDLSKKIHQYIDKNTGATDIIMSYIDKKLQ